MNHRTVIATVTAVAATLAVIAMTAAAGQDAPTPAPTVTVTATAPPAQVAPAIVTGAGELGDPTLLPTCDPGTEAPATPCVASDRVTGIDITGPDATVHAGCDVILTSAEDSLAVCPDGFTAES